MITTASAPSKSFCSARWPGACLSPARQLAKFTAPSALFAGSLSLQNKELEASLSGSPLQPAESDPCLMRSQELRLVALKPGFVGHPLTPHDVPARAGAYWCNYCLSGTKRTPGAGSVNTSTPAARRASRLCRRRSARDSGRSGFSRVAPSRRQRCDEDAPPWRAALASIRGAPGRRVSVLPIRRRSHNFRPMLCWDLRPDRPNRPASWATKPTQ